MKNLKKISRKELKNLVGGKNLSVALEESFIDEGSSTQSLYKCCTDLYTCGSCGTGSSCPSGQFLRAC
jgi:hypothetical protein